MNQNATRQQELYEAADRLRSGLMYDCSQCESDKDSLVDAWLDEHLSDDLEPITSRWLKESGFENKQWIDGDCWRFQAIRVYDPLDHNGTTRWTVLVGAYRVSARRRFQTRGDLRLLCRALGITLNEA